MQKNKKIKSFCYEAVNDITIDTNSESLVSVYFPGYNFIIFKEIGNYNVYINLTTHIIKVEKA